VSDPHPRGLPRGKYPCSAVREDTEDQ